MAELDPRDLLSRALTGLQLRAAEIGSRLEYYEGRHPVALGSADWDATFRARYESLIDNHCARVVDKHAEAVAVDEVVLKGELDEKRPETKFARALAAWATEWFELHSATLDRRRKMAEASGVQTAVLVDYDQAGHVSLYEPHPLSCWVETTADGVALWALTLWKEDEQANTSATLYLPNEVIVLGSTTRDNLPRSESFTESYRQPNPSGVVPFAAVNRRGSIIDRIRPLNDKVNMSHQHEAVAEEGLIMPMRAWLGFESYIDGESGEIRNPMPRINAATGARDLSFPTSTDAEGGERQVIQLESADPTRYLAARKEAIAEINMHGSLPSTLTGSGSQPQTAEALEIDWLSFIGLTQANQRLYRSYDRRIAELAVRLHLLATTGRAVPPPALDVAYSQISTQTRAASVQQFREARDGGMPLRAALVRFLGLSEPEADLVAEELEQEQSRAASVFEAGADALGEF